MALAPDGTELPCRNPNCKSVGASHPGCRCYGQATDIGRASGNTVSRTSGPAKASAGSRANMAEGGVVGHFCDGCQEHMPTCEYFKAGGKVKKKDSRTERAEKLGFDTSKTWYHGTKTPEFSSFDLTRSPPGNPGGQARGAIFLSDDPTFANSFAVPRSPRHREAIIPVHTRVKNTFDYENPEHLAAVRQNLATRPEVHSDLVGVPKAGIDPEARLDWAMQMIKEGQWPAIEQAPVQEAIKKLGFDSFHVREMGTKNLAVFDPKHIRSKFAEFNPEHVEENHLSLAEGGVVRNKDVAKHAHEYMRAKGFPVTKSTYHPVDPARGRAIAKEFEAMKHEPHDPKVKAAYDALIGETLDQFQQMKKAGLKIEKIQPGQSNPYKNSTDLHKDVEKGHMWFYPTEQGFGTMTNLQDHPLMAPTDEVVDGHKMLANDVFRVVHDYFGHAKEGYSFGPKGEENAWREHSKMYGPEARKALTTETRGQNSWVNYGPYGQQNKERPAQTTYADQKAGLLPDWVSEEPQELTHYSQHPGALKSIDPKFMGTGKAGRESRRPGRIPRQYFYEPDTEPEDIVMQGAKHVHKISRPHDILDLAHEDAGPILQGARDQDHLEELIRDAGYSGYKNSASQSPGAVALFGEHPVIDSEEITPEHFKKGYAEGGEVEAPQMEPLEQVGTKCLQDALANGFLKGHGDISDAILGHADSAPLVAAVTANGGAPSLLKLSSSSVFSPRVAAKQKSTAEHSLAFKSGIGAAHYADIPGYQGPHELGAHPWFNRGAIFHQAMPALQADPNTDTALEPTAEKLIGRDVHGSAQDFLGPTTIKLLSQDADPDEMEHGIHFAEHVGRGLQKIKKAVDNIFDPEAESTHAPDLRMRKKLHEYVESGGLQEEMQQELSQQDGGVTEGTDPIAKHFPDPNMRLQQTKGNVVSALNSMRPQSTPALPFDTPFVSGIAQRKYEQFLDVANDPLSVMTKIKTGTITPTDIHAMLTMYPDLYSHLKQELTAKISDVQVKKEFVLPKTRRALSVFLGTPLDSTMTPQSISNIQAMFAKQRAAGAAQQQQKPGAPQKGNTAKLDKASQNAQTNSQALAARQQRPR